MSCDKDDHGRPLIPYIAPPLWNMTSGHMEDRTLMRPPKIFMEWSQMLDNGREIVMDPSSDESSSDELPSNNICIDQSIATTSANVEMEDPVSTSKQSELTCPRKHPLLTLTYSSSDDDSSSSSDEEASVIASTGVSIPTTAEEEETGDGIDKKAAEETGDDMDKKAAGVSSPVMEDDLVNNVSFMTEMESHMENALREGDSDI